MAQKGGDLALLLPECSICMDTIKDARLLVCGHTFCEKCLQEHTNKSPFPGTVIECPECRKEIALPPNGVSGLPRNYSLQFTIDQLQIMNLAQAATPVVLEAAEEVKPIVERKYISKCKKHSTEVTNFCCETCQDTLICRDCTVVDHKGHQFVNIKDKSDKLKASLTTLVGEHQEMTQSVLAVNQREAVTTIKASIWHLQSEAQGAAEAMIQEIETQRDEFIGQAQQIGRNMEEKVDSMYYNSRPIDDIVEMIGRGNEYEITEKFAQAQEHLQVSLSEMRDKMDAKLMPSVARCLALKKNGSLAMEGKSKMFGMMLKNLSWKLASKVIVNTKGCNDAQITSFTCMPNGNWHVLYERQSMMWSQNSVVVKELSKSGCERSQSFLTSYKKPVDIKSTKDKRFAILSLSLFPWNVNKWSFYMSGTTGGTGTLSHKELPIKGGNATGLHVYMDSEDQMWIPEANGHKIWSIQTPSGQSTEFSVNGFFHPINVAVCGPHLYLITSCKKVMRRLASHGGIPEPCSINTKLGDPMQLLVDPITNEVLIVYHRHPDQTHFELNIYQLATSKPIIDPILLDWVPSVKKADISRKGNLAILLASGQDGVILDYEREDLSAVSDILNISP